MRNRYDRSVPSAGLTVDSPAGPVDTVAVDRIRQGHRVPLTIADNRWLDDSLSYDRTQVRVVAEGLGVSLDAVMQRVARARRRAAA